MSTAASGTKFQASLPEDPAAQPLIFTAARERGLSRMLMVYAVTGLLFMLLPGTFLGVWNLLSISQHQAAGSVAPAWLQAHGHAQFFGWIGTFIIGIGFYSIPKLRRIGAFALSEGWVSWALWTAGVALRWMVNIYQWQWRVLLPLSAVLELSAFLIFFRAVSGHGAAGNERKGFESWVIVVIGATVGFLLTLMLNLGAAFYLAARGDTVAFPHNFNQRFLTVTAWGFLVPFVWGFSARWLPVFLGLKPLRERLLLISFGGNAIGVAAALFGWTMLATVILVMAVIGSVAALRLFEPARQPAKVRGVHASFPAFVRLAYLWLILAAALGVWASSIEQAAGIWGASRHALTVGFLSVMVFSIGPRVLPAFSGLRLLFSTKLMFAALALLNVGCALRVSSEVFAYQGYGEWAWGWLPVSAVIELTAVAVFALNMGVTFARRPRSIECEPYSPA
jgi:hypothetical protein